MNGKEFNNKKFLDPTLYKINSNIGIICGKISNIFVFDVDGLNDNNPKTTFDAQVILKKLDKIFPDDLNTYRVKTGSGGYHLYFEYDPRVTTRIHGLHTIIQGVGYKTTIDIKSNTSYVVAPPSIHPNGNSYEIVNNCKIKKAPEWLINWITCKTRLRLLTQNYEDYDSNDLIEFDPIEIKQPKKNITEYTTKNYDEIDTILSLIDDDYFHNYGTWHSLAYILYRELGDDLGYKLYDKHSRRSSKYNSSEVELEFDKAIKYIDNTDNPKTIGSLIFEAQKNPKFKDWYNGNKKLGAKKIFKEMFDIPDKLEDECPLHSIKYKCTIDDWTKLVNHQYLSFDLINEFIIHNIAFIFEGGKPYFITKCIKNKVIEFKKSNRSELNIISFVIDGKIYKFGDLVCQILHKIQYSYVDFIPKYNIHDDKYFNLFTGLRINNLQVDKDDKKLETVLNHLKEVWCNNGEEEYQYLLNWFAHLFQKTEDKVQVAIVLKGKDGGGKGCIIEWIGNHILGEQYMFQGSLEEVAGTYNGLLEKCLLANINEPDTYGLGYKYEGTLKTLITDKSQTIRRKYENQYIVKNSTRFIFTTNNDFVVKVGENDRRYVCLETNNTYCLNKKYFKVLHDALNDNSAKAFYEMMMNRDISDWNFMNIPKTKLRDEMKFHSLHPIQKFIIHHLDSETLDELIEVADNDNNGFSRSNYLFEKFKEYLQYQNCDTKITLNGFSREFTKLITNSERFTLNGKTTRGFAISKSHLSVKFKDYIQ